MKKQRFSLSSDSGEVFSVDYSHTDAYDFNHENSFHSRGKSLSSGITVLSSNISVHTPLRYAFSARNTPLTLSFCMEGKANISVDVRDRQCLGLVHSTSICTMSHLTRAEGTWQPSCGRYRMVDLVIPAPQESPLWKELEGSLPPELKPLAYGAPPGDFFYSLPISPEIQAAVCSLEACPVPRENEHLYMECKTREIIILLISHLSRMRSMSEKAIPLSSADIEGIHEARRILETNLETPPSLMQLARMAEINEFKLKKGFRQLFGTTPFSHLRETRLETARSHLESGEFNVCEACMAVGYSNLGNFIGLFRKRFGITPGDVLRSAQRTRHMAN